ncbi:MAG: ribonuclease III [Mariprofundaceae bacterium]|nr:ribonuclease III [Mariprofundaceae bacterium]
MNYAPLEKIITYVFKDKALLKQALTHSSISKNHLERHEFLGDAVLGLVIAKALFLQFPDSAEGELSKMRANLVCKQALLDIATLWGLADYLAVGAGERDQDGALKSESIAANAVEAVIGAVFQDSGWFEVEQVVKSAWAEKLQESNTHDLRDAKSKLQEITQGNALGLPHYRIEDLGVQQSPRFKASCILNSYVLGVGMGERKKTAEIMAAEQALKHQTIGELTAG